MMVHHVGAAARQANLHSLRGSPADSRQGQAPLDAPPEKVTDEFHGFGWAADFLPYEGRVGTLDSSPGTTICARSGSS